MTSVAIHMFKGKLDNKTNFVFIAQREKTEDLNSAPNYLILYTLL